MLDSFTGELRERERLKCLSEGLGGARCDRSNHSSCVASGDGRLLLLHIAAAHCCSAEFAAAAAHNNTTKEDGRCFGPRARCYRRSRADKPYKFGTLS